MKLFVRLYIIINAFRCNGVLFACLLLKDFEEVAVGYEIVQKFTYWKISSNLSGCLHQKNGGFIMLKPYSKRRMEELICSLDQRFSVFCFAWYFQSR